MALVRLDLTLSEDELALLHLILYQCSVNETKAINWNSTIVQETIARIKSELVRGRQNG
jgi:hypothetical protein